MSARPPVRADARTHARADARTPGRVRPGVRADASERAHAIGLRGEPVRHLVPEDPLLAALDGELVVMALCASIGRYRTGAPPAEFAACPECAQALRLGG